MLGAPKLKHLVISDTMVSMMRLDHVSYACGPEGLDATVARISEQLGIDRVKGGIHPRFGTRNAIFPMANTQYLEVVEVLEHPAADKAPFGQAVRARSEMGGGWLGWAVAVDDLAPFEDRLERKAVPGNRKFPDGQELTWQQIGIRGLIADPQVPFMLKWDEGMEVLHPSRASEPQAEISKVVIAGHRPRVRDWLGLQDDEVVEDISVEFINPEGQPGIMSVTFKTPLGEVTI